MLMFCWNRLWLSLSISVWLALCFIQCSSSTVWEPPAAQNNRCDPSQPTVANHPDWKLFVAQARAASEGMPACLQMAWGDSTPTQARTTLVRLTHDGNLRASPSSKDSAPGLSLPAEANQKKLRFRVFVFHPTTNAQRHATLCAQQMTDVTYSCLDASSECLFGIEFLPTAREFSGGFFSVQGSPGATCQLLLRTLPEEKSSEVSEPSSEETLPDDAGSRSEQRPEPAVQEERPPEPATCQPGTKRGCYTGAPKTRGVGRCKDGLQICGPNGQWEACLGDFTPIPEHCDAQDHDCDGKTGSANCINAWIQTAGQQEDNPEIPNGLVTDPSGNIYVSGVVPHKPASFGTFQRNGLRALNVFVARLNPQGEWTHYLENVDTQVINQEGLGMARDPKDGSLVIVGRFAGNLKLGSLRLLGTFDKDGQPSADGFVAKLDKDLKVLWLSHLRGIGQEQCQGVVIDASSRIFVTCFASGRSASDQISSPEYISTRDKVELTVSQQTVAASFVLQLEPDGTLRKHLVLDQPQKANPSHYLSSIQPAVDAQGRLYLAGSFSGTQSWGSLNLTSAGRNDVFVGCLDSELRWLWVRQAGSFLSDEAVSIKLGPDRHLYLTGTFMDVATFGTTRLTSAGEEDIFVTKLDLQGTWKWAVSAGGPKRDLGRDITVTEQGEVYVTGSIRGEARFGILPTPTFGSTDSDTLFLAKLTTRATWAWVHASGHGYQVMGTALTTSTQGDVIFAGMSNHERFGTWLLFPFKRGKDLFVVKNPQLLLGYK